MQTTPQSPTTISKPTQVTDDVFLDANQRGGDVGNDLKMYGGKLYCVVNNSKMR